MLSLELKEFLHNIKDHDYDICGQYKVDKNEADKVIKQLERLDKIFVNADEIEPDDEIFKDDYLDKNTQNGWIYCKDRLPKECQDVLVVDIDGDIYITHKINLKEHMDCYDYYGNKIKSIIAWQPLPEWEVDFNDN